MHSLATYIVVYEETLIKPSLWYSFFCVFTVSKGNLLDIFVVWFVDNKESKTFHMGSKNYDNQTG